MTAPRSWAALAAAAVTAAVLLARWWVSFRHSADDRAHRQDTDPTGDERIGELHSAMPDTALTTRCVRRVPG
ncbi:hypothetical protein GCM10010383_72410 [Streptomyces lomondensis]|uniref:Secreted protein n=1 Tax=Streptomyces lomondensis TaxID=68229 RepID=A0ABQ2XS53_9ACTN|nr:hypothetical protein GCM10010383_72410 [Streptomyces lomondensis]